MRQLAAKAMRPEDFVCDVLVGCRANLLAVDEQYDTIDERPRDRLEAKLQPGRIVRHIEDERPVARERERDARPLEIVRSRANTKNTKGTKVTKGDAPPWHRAMIRAMIIAALLAAVFVQEAAPKKIDLVSVTGCLREPTAGTWMLTGATDPVASTANAPAAKDIPTAPPAGKNEYRLIGVSEFNLPAHKGHTVLVKGLHIKATPVSRLNVTSVTMVSSSCAAEK